MLAYTTALPADTGILLLCIRLCFVQVSADMAKLVEKGVNSFKFFFAYKHEGLMVRDEVGRLCSKPPLLFARLAAHTGLCCSSHAKALGCAVPCCPMLGPQLALQHVSRAAAPVMCSGTPLCVLLLAVGTYGILCCPLSAAQGVCTAVDLLHWSLAAAQCDCAGTDVLHCSLAAAVPLCAATL